MELRTNLLHSRGWTPEPKSMSFCILYVKLLLKYLNWLGILNSNQRRQRELDAKEENKPRVNIPSELSGYFDEDEEEEIGIPNIEKDDLYFRKLSSSAANTVVAFDKFLPKFWTPEEELLWKKIRKSSFKPWYKEIQGFRCVFMHAPVSLLCAKPTNKM